MHPKFSHSETPMAFLKILAFTCLIILMALGTLPQCTAAQGLFSEIKNNVRKQPTAKTKKNRQAHSAPSTEPLIDSFIGEDVSDAIGLAVIGAISMPLALPISIAEDKYRTKAYFPGYPYQDNSTGYLMLDRSSQHEPITSEPFSYSIQSSIEYTYYSNEISKIGNRFLVDTTSRFGIDGEFSYWKESLPGNANDNFWAGDTNVIFRFAQAESFQMRTGLGLNWLSDNLGSDFGFNFTYKGDFFPIDPLVISAELDLGKIGSSNLSHVRITTGMNFRHAEVFVGYDHFRLGETEFDGFISGLRIWF